MELYLIKLAENYCPNKPDQLKFCSLAWNSLLGVVVGRFALSFISSIVIDLLIEPFAKWE